MPELPEVETMVRDLATRLPGRTIASVQAEFPAIVRRPDYQQLAERVMKRRITAVTRRAKFARFGLDSGETLVVHRGMTGSLLLRAPETPPDSHVRILFTLDDGSELRFRDARKFGKLYLIGGADNRDDLAPWTHMGLEPLEAEFTAVALRRALVGRTGALKPLMLNQRVVVGLGNIYIDEALNLARIHPARRVNTLTPAEIGRLHRAIRSVLLAAVQGRGTTFSTYTDFEGRSGRYQDRLRVYGKTGQECVSCATPVVKTVLGGRGTHFCPRCQKV